MDHDNIPLSEIKYGSGHGTTGSYIIGFILSIVLTLIPFFIVAKQLLSDTSLYIAITILALAQLLVQLIFFLHLNTSSKARWNMLAFVFSFIVVVILVFGSLWIMYNLNYNMVN